MTITLQAAAFDALIDLFGNIKGWLDKAAASGNESALMEARLAPDMHPLPRQIQMASDSAKGAAARLTGGEAPSMPDTEASFAELKARCDKTIAYLKSVDPGALEAGAAREIVLTFPNGGGMKFDGTTFLTRFVVPNCLFHTAMTYAILRNAGVELGKADYLAGLAPFMFAPPQA